MEFEEFRTLIARKGKKKYFKVTNAFTIYQIYKYIRKQHWYDIGRPVTEKEFYSIIRRVNKRLADNIVLGENVKFPYNMGELELRKFERGVRINKNGELKVDYPIDWDKTLRLWFEDEEARKNKIIVRDESGHIYKVLYKKFNANYNNRVFYEFKLHQKVKKALKDNINKGITDSIW